MGSENTTRVALLDLKMLFASATMGVTFLDQAAHAGDIFKEPFKV